jgi:stage II sporulation protein D
MTYKNEPILAVYHSDSGGKTENSENYWSSPLPYLRSVDDPYSKQPPVIEVRQMSDVLAKVQRIPNRTKVSNAGGGGAARTGEAAAATTGNTASAPLVEIIERYRSGRVKSVRVSDTIVTGRALREALGLRSNWFDVSVTGSTIRFVQYGYGHGVGMPQYGADGMAKKGYGFEDILKYYYQGVELTKAWH